MPVVRGNQGGAGSVPLQAIPNVKLEPIAPVDITNRAALRSLDESSYYLLNIAQDERKKADQVLFMGADKRLSDWESRTLYDEQAGLLRKRGVQAFGIPEQAKAGFDAEVEAIQKGFARDEQRQVWGARAQDRWHQVDRAVQNHVYAERSSYDKELFDASINNYIGLAGQKYENPQAIATEIDNINAAVWDFGHRYAKPPAWIAAQQQEARGKAHTLVITSLLDRGDDLAASKYYALNREDIGGEQQVKLAKPLLEGSLRGESQRMADKVIDAAGGRVRAMEMAKEVQNPKLRELVEHRLDWLYGQEAKGLQDEQTLRTAKLTREAMREADRIVGLGLPYGQSVEEAKKIQAPVVRVAAIELLGTLKKADEAGTKAEAMEQFAQIAGSGLTPTEASRAVDALSPEVQLALRPMVSALYASRQAAESQAKTEHDRRAVDEAKQESSRIIGESKGQGLEAMLGQVERITDLTVRELVRTQVSSVFRLDEAARKDTAMRSGEGKADEVSQAAKTEAEALRLVNESGLTPEGKVIAADRVKKFFAIQARQQEAWRESMFENVHRELERTNGQADIPLSARAGLSLAQVETLENRQKQLLDGKEGKQDHAVWAAFSSLSAAEMGILTKSKLMHYLSKFDGEHRALAADMWAKAQREKSGHGKEFTDSVHYREQVVNTLRASGVLPAEKELSQLKGREALRFGRFESEAVKALSDFEQGKGGKATPVERQQLLDRMVLDRVKVGRSFFGADPTMPKAALLPDDTLDVPWEQIPQAEVQSISNRLVQSGQKPTKTKVQTLYGLMLSGNLDRVKELLRGR